jgi:hypothetical protein
LITLNLKNNYISKTLHPFLIKADVFCGKINIRVNVHKFLPRLGQALRAPGG